MPTLIITGIQANLQWEDKKANLEMFENRISSIEGPKQIVVLPEMFSTGFSMNPEKLAEAMNGETVRWMQKISKQYNIILAGSLIIRDRAPIDSNSATRDVYYNRLIWMLPNGNFGSYDKRHLFAYGDEDQHYTGGRNRLIASVNGWKVNLLICYDLRFPVWSRQAPPLREQQEQGTKHGTSTPPRREERGPGGEAEAEYDLLIYVANWPERRSLAWKTLLQARAIENQCYVVGVNRVGSDGNGVYYSGDSMAIGPLGEILYQKANEEDIFTVRLDKLHLQSVRQKFPFWKGADNFKIVTDT